MRNIFNTLLVLLFMANVIVILSILMLSARSLVNQNHLLDILFPLKEGICHVTISASIFMTVTITVESYVAVSRPYSY